MPGIALSRPWTTWRMLGTAEIRRRIRSTRKARNTENESIAGTIDSLITTKSNTLHGSRTKPRR